MRGDDRDARGRGLQEAVDPQRGRSANRSFWCRPLRGDIYQRFGVSAVLRRDVEARSGMDRDIGPQGGSDRVLARRVDEFAPSSCPGLTRQEPSQPRDRVLGSLGLCRVGHPAQGSELSLSQSA